MEIAFQEWADLLFRWLHLVTGIAWIGSSFYFIWLDLSLRQREGMSSDVFGENWSVHGGGFYHSQKYLTAPKQMPTELHWFKYEAYFTWISGFFLMAIIYYWEAEYILIDSNKFAFTPWQAILISMAFLFGGWIVYDLICKSRAGENTLVLAVVVFVLLVGFSVGLSNVFSDRAALLHVGAIIGSMMVGNVFFVIIPNQKKVVADLISGEKPDHNLGKEAKQRSTHNNYLTLPVLLIMISNHYPILANQDRVWIVVALILVIGGVIRHFFNTLHMGMNGKKILWQLPVSTLLVVILVIIASYRVGFPDMQKTNIKAADAMAIISKRCVSCHSRKPDDKSFDQPSGGLSLEHINEVKKHSKKILSQAVYSKAMPLGNKTNITAKERETLGAWIGMGMPE